MGVKSLWSLLTPVGRPIMLETFEGKIMAIDSSIWIYQFQATMRDKDGRALLNAHVLGFLRRISKLLFYGIKPVFVFDGGAPVLKRMTLRERRQKKSGAAANHTKLAEKLLAAQMRREALNHTDLANHSPSSKSKGKQRKIPSLEDDGTVYLEDIDLSMPRTPARKKPAEPLSSSKKNKFHDHDPYRLPEVDLEEAVAKATRSAAPDPRLATEDELQAFIEDMRPEDFDVTSPAFRELPTEVQYEIVGDLRLKSRQTSYARLQNMLKSAPTPLDFSKQQIKNLRQRNTLTQQLLITTDTIGSAHISIPVRIASERNKEYVLLKNEGESGGWILGIRDDGTRQKPIEIDHDDEKQIEEESDEDMEEVKISGPVTVDPDLREYQQTMALSAIGNRSSQQLPSTSNRLVTKNTSTQPLFDVDEEDEGFIQESYGLDSGDDDMLAIAIQASLDQETEHVPHINTTPPRPLLRQQPSPYEPLDIAKYTFETPTRLETALSIANAGSSRNHRLPVLSSVSSVFGRPTLLSSSVSEDTPTTEIGSPVEVFERIIGSLPRTLHKSPKRTVAPHVDADGKKPLEENNISFLQTEERGPAKSSEDYIESDSEEKLEEIIPPSPTVVPETVPSPRLPPLDVHVTGAPNDPADPVDQISKTSVEPSLLDTQSELTSLATLTVDHEDEEDLIPWSRSPSPSNELPNNVASPVAEETWDAAEEMDPHAEEGEYARFISQVKGKKIEDVRREIDDEIKFLNQQRKAAMRDSEDITQQMITQIMAMLRLFGIPYITAPMEAEAQCAELVSLGLADGVITDDSDVFLFGAQRVFKNMFNQSKTVECFLLTDLGRELGLERDTLIRLAYLLGSDYVDGLPGVGPVVAMELLKEFPGEDGLHKFKDWWIKVQTGKDTAADSKSPFRRKFKKKFKELYLSDEWPNPAVKDAYYHPTVDSSEEPFKWGLPDLDALRAFFQEELSWGQGKVDDILLPIIQKMNKRGQVAAMNKQSNLNEFFDVSAGSGTYAPRKRQAYTSKRLQDVVNDFRKKRARGSTSPGPSSSTRSRSPSPVQTEGEPMPTKKRRKVGENAKVTRKSRANTSKAATKKGAVAKGSRGGSSRNQDFSEDDEELQDRIEIPPDPVVVARLRPRPKPAYNKPQEQAES